MKDKDYYKGIAHELEQDTDYTDFVRKVENKEYLLKKSEKKPFTKLTDDEKTWISVKFTCPDCLTGNFIEGPHGGTSVNVYCNNPDCGSRFNLTPFTEGKKTIKFLFAERI